MRQGKKMVHNCELGHCTKHYVQNLQHTWIALLWYFMLPP